MSLMEPPKVRPVTAVAWTSNAGTSPKDFTLITITEDGSNANFTRSFAIKSGYYLCFSKELKEGLVVSDIQVISDKEAIPPGYSFIKEYIDSKTNISKKKRVCVRMSAVASVETAVLDIKLTAKSKMMLQHYTYVGDINQYVLWCRKGHFSSPFPKAKPRNLSLDVRSLSLDESTPPPLPLRQSNPNAPPQPPGRLSHRRHTLQVIDNPGDSSTQGITALDGVPFSLHPDFDVPADGTALQLNSQLGNIRIKSLKDIENEYSYTFSVEEFAAKRIRPSVPTESGLSSP